MNSGDIRLGDTIDVKFTTRRFTTGAPFTLAGSPVISAYVGNGTTEITAGITLTVDFDARTGLNNVRVVATSGNGFATATNVDLVITTGTVDGVSVVGEVIGSFSIENRSAVMPTTAGRTLTIESDGMAHADVKEIEGTDATNVLDALDNALLTAVDDLPTNAELATALAAADDAVLAAIAALNNLSIANVRTAVGLASANLDTQLAAIAAFIDTEIASLITLVGDVPTNAELATALAAADDAVLAAIAALNNLSSAQAQTAAAAALTAYDPPTHAEMEARTIAAASYSTVTTAQVNAEVVDALATDTYAEPGQGTPAATLSLAAKIGYLFKAWRNKKTQTSSQYSLMADDATTVDQKAAVTDDGTTTTVGEVATGP